MNNVLILNLDKEYFNDIINGNKVEEYREVKEYWRKRLSKNFNIIEFRMGYPKKDDKSRIARFDYLGYEIKNIVHKKFNNKSTKVYAIKIGKRLDWWKSV